MSLGEAFKIIVDGFFYFAIKKRCYMEIGEKSVVSFRSLRHSPPSRLIVGNSSIVQARISGDKKGAEVRIGSNTFIGGSHIVAASFIDIGNDVMISWGCTIVDHNSHSISWSSRSLDVKNTFQGIKDWSVVDVSPVKICDKAWIGFNVIILKGVVIGEGAVVGAGSVVTKNVEPYTVVGGNPARVIKKAKF